MSTSITLSAPIAMSLLAEIIEKIDTDKHLERFYADSEDGTAMLLAHYPGAGLIIQEIELILSADDTEEARKGFQQMADDLNKLFGLNTSDKL